MDLGFDLIGEGGLGGQLRRDRLLECAVVPCQTGSKMDPLRKLLWDLSLALPTHCDHRHAQAVQRPPT